MSADAALGNGETCDGRAVVVVPCYNEEHRLDARALLDLAESGDVRLLFVNDGSTDGTDALLDQLSRASESIDILDLKWNVGKAEAVRRGLCRAIAAGAPIVGYFDADLATPGSELLRMIRILTERTELTAVFGSRIARLGSDIRRSLLRHYTGRVFATFASMALGVAVYDTQCGAKVFRVNETFVAATEKPFRSRWSFDVVLCQRLFDGTSDVPGLPTSSFLELPLEQWSDMEGSKVNLVGSMLALGDVIVVGVERRSHLRNRRVFKRSGQDASAQHPK